MTGTSGERGGFRTRCGAIARALAERPSVGHLLVVSTPHSFGMNAARAIRGRLTSSSDPRTTLRPFVAQEVRHRVTALEQTRILPARAVPRASRGAYDVLYDRALRRATARTCSSLGMRDCVLWVADPLMARHIGMMGESLSVFDAIDDWTAHPQKQALLPSIQEGYALVRERADIIFTVSRSLARPAR